MSLERPMMDDQIGVLVVDDSALMRNLVSRIVNNETDMTVVSTAMNGAFALEKIERYAPDVIVLDLEMPEMNGIEFLKERKRRGIEIPVIILSSIASRGAQVTMEALALGAADFVTKPSGSVSHDIHVVGEQLLALLRAFGGVFHKRRGGRAPTRSPRPDALASSGTSGAVGASVGTAAPRGTPAEPARRHPAARPGTLELIAIGISTGGPNALRDVLAHVDADIGVPIVVVQHMPKGFTEEFARSLDRISPLSVREAADRDIVAPGDVVVAPGDQHLEVERRGSSVVVHLTDAPASNGHRPSVGVLFSSAARAFGNRCMGVIMTGMGRDGAIELGEIWAAGGVTIAQDEASSVVYGMPRVAVEQGVVERQVALGEMAATISTLAAELRAH